MLPMVDGFLFESNLEDFYSPFPLPCLESMSRQLDTQKSNRMTCIERGCHISCNHEHVDAYNGVCSTRSTCIFSWERKKNVSFACDQVKAVPSLCSLLGYPHEQVSAPDPPVSLVSPRRPSFFLLHLDFFSTSERVRGGSTVEVSDVLRGPQKVCGGGGRKVLCKCKRARSVVKADGNPRRHLCIWKPPSPPIWDGVVYRGKIKHAVICRQFCPPSLLARLPPLRTNCVGRACG